MSTNQQVGEVMRCVANEGTTCPCSAVAATGGTCEVFGPLPTFAEAFPHLAKAAQSSHTTTQDHEETP